MLLAVRLLRKIVCRIRGSSNGRTQYMFYTYVLQSQKDGKLYVGWTVDLTERFKEHRVGLVKSTKSRRPWQLIYYEACLEETDAINREKQLKTGFGRRYLKDRIGTLK